MGTAARGKGTGQRQGGASRATAPGKTAARGDSRFDPSAAGRYPARNPHAGTPAPVVRAGGQRCLLIFAATPAEAERVALNKKWPAGFWQHVTRVEDTERWHPNKVVIFAVEGFHKDHPEYLAHQKALMYRLRLYGVEATYV